MADTGEGEEAEDEEQIPLAERAAALAQEVCQAWLLSHC